MIAGEDQPHLFARCRNPAEAMAMARQVEMGDPAGPGVAMDQLLKSREAVADHVGEELEGHGEDLPARLAGPSDVEDPGFAFAVDEALEHQPFADREALQV